MRDWNDLTRNLYVRPTVTVTGQHALECAKIEEAKRLGLVIARLYSDALAQAWGRPGEAGNPTEIRHVCKLIAAAAEQTLRWEESVRVISVANTYVGLLSCLPGVAGRQLDVVRGIPHQLDEAVEWAELNPGISGQFNYNLVFDLPSEWNARIERELENIKRRK